MSAKHPAKSLSLRLPPDLRAALRARIGRNRSLADAARRVLQAALADCAPPVSVCGAGQGRPVRLQLPVATRAALDAAARARGTDPATVALGLLAGALRP